MKYALLLLALTMAGCQKNESVWVKTEYNIYEYTGNIYNKNGLSTTSRVFLKIIDNRRMSIIFTDDYIDDIIYKATNSLTYGFADIVYVEGSSRIENDDIVKTSLTYYINCEKPISEIDTFYIKLYSDNRTYTYRFNPLNMIYISKKTICD